MTPITETATRSTERVTVAGGRRLAVHEQQWDGDRTVLFFHPAPGGGLFDPDPEPTATRGVTLIEIDRPGYGGSEPVATGEWATVASAADDAAEVLDRRRLGPVGVAGWSAGGRVALALAARRPDLVDRVAVIGTPAPHEEVPWMAAEVAAGVEALRGLPAADAHAAMAAQLGGLAAAAAESPAVGLDVLGAGPGDEAVLAAPGSRDRLVGLVSAAFAQGAAGIVADLAGYTLQPWGFEPSAVQAKTLLLYGGADPVAGAAHGRWWQRQLPDARLETVPGTGHLLIVPIWKRVLSFLSPRR